MRKPSTAAKSPDPVRMLQANKAVLEARRLLESGKMDQAAQLVATIVQAEPDHLGAIKLMGHMAMQTGSTEMAISCFTRAQALAPKAPEVLLDLGNALIAGNRPAEAVSALKKALLARPNDGAIYRSLGQAQLDAGHRADALKSFRKTLAILPYDQFAGHFVTALSGEGNKQGASYVADLFDKYADKFDEHLTGSLEYRVPQAVRDLVADRAPFAAVLDLGCGTGLVGVELKDMAKAIDGTDIAPLMTRKTEERGIYRHVRTGDTVTLLANDPALAGPYDLVTAGDVFVYVGPLEATFAAVAKVIAPKGFFAFSVETGSDDGVMLRSSGRFAHSSAYIHGLAATYAFSVVTERPTILRQERNEPIQGTLYLLQRG